MPARHDVRHARRLAARRLMTSVLTGGLAALLTACPPTPGDGSAGPTNPPGPRLGGVTAMSPGGTGYSPRPMSADGRYVAERLGFGPDVCLARNPRLVFGRMTGWGQEGPYAHTAGHDIYYISLGGAQDFGYPRALIAAGQVPRPADLDPAGFFAEHSTPRSKPRA